MQALVYKSNAVKPFDEAALDEIAAHAVEKNQRIGITGFLYFRQGQNIFLQYLEGSGESLDGLMRQIEADERHTVQSVASLPSGFTRRFPRWSMRRLIDDAVMGVRLEDVVTQVLASLAVRAYDPPAAAARIASIVDRIAAQRTPDDG